MLVLRGERHEKGSGVRIIKLFAEITVKMWLKRSVGGRRLCGERKWWAPMSYPGTGRTGTGFNDGPSSQSA